MKPSLSIVLARKKSLTVLLQQAAALPLGAWCLEDEAAQVVFGKMPDHVSGQKPIWVDNQQIGEVKSEHPENASFIVALMENWFQQEMERRELGAETLHMYREINLIFSFAEKLATVLGVDAIARLLLDEVGHIVRFEAGGILLYKKNTGKAQLPAAYNAALLAKIPADFLKNTINSGKAVITVAPVDGEPMCLCAPLCFGKAILGGMVLMGASFSAADLKLSVTLAAQAAAAMENAVQHELSTTQALKEQRERLTLELALKDPYFKHIMAIVETSYTDPAFSVESLANALHLSVSQLQRKINTVTELTPIEIIRSVRLARAKDLLQNTPMNVSEVAFEVGFNDPSYFTRLFVKELRCTPSEWREKAIRSA